MKYRPLRRISGAGNDAFPLAKYSEGYNVEQLQRLLNAWLAAWPTLRNKPALLTVDGKFGDKTQTALVWGTGEISISQADFIRLQNTLSWASKTPYAARFASSTPSGGTSTGTGTQGNPDNLPPELRPTPTTTTTSGGKTGAFLLAGILLLILGGGANG